MKSATRKVNRHVVIKRFRNGQALVEMALCAAVLLLLMVVSIEGGLALAMSQSFTGAAREASRYVTAGHTPEDARSTSAIDSIVRSKLAERFGANSSITQNAQITASPDPSTAAPGTRVTVTVAYALPQSWLINRGGSINIRGRGVFELQDSVAGYTPANWDGSSGTTGGGDDGNGNGKGKGKKK